MADKNSLWTWDNQQKYHEKIMQEIEDNTTNNSLTIDTELSDTSENAVQNKVITAELNKKLEESDVSKVAISNSYNDLDNKPTSLPASDVSEWAKAETKPTYTASEVGADAKGSADTALASAKSYADTKDTATLNSAKSYTDSKIDAIVGEGAAETLDTIGEISSAIEENQDMLDTLNSTIGNKANASDLTSHVNNKSNPHTVTKAQVGLGNVENKSSATIRSEITSENVTDALGYTPPDSDEATESESGLMSATDKVKLNATNIGYGTCSTAAGTAAKVVTLVDNDNWKLGVGSTVIVKFSATNTAQNPTLNVNGTGAKSIWCNTAVITTGSLSYAGTANRPMKFVYDGTNYIFMGWSMDYNTTYTNASLGQGYGTCSTAAATVAKVVTLSSYALTTGGIVAVKFTNAVPANATMNINSKGAKAIYYRGAAITANVIKAGDIGVFIYNGSQYHLLTVDRDSNTTYSQATSSNLGLVKIGYTESGKNYPVELNSDGQMFVNVPWKNTTYSNFGKSGSGAKAGLVPAPSTTAGTTKYLREDGTWQVPPDTNTTYTLSSFGVTVTAAELNYCNGVTGNIQTQLDNKLSLSGGTVTGSFKLAHASSTTEGGQVDLLAPPSGSTYNGISIDTAKGLLRIFGIASADGATKTGTGTVLSIDPYAKTIVGGYTITGTVSNATSQSSTAATSPNTSYLRNVATGTAAATTSNCPTGTLYGQYS